MKAIEVKDGIYWVGAVDWNERNFHGYRTEQGTTYNAYLILDEKVTLIDTVRASYTEEMLERIASVIDASSIEVVIANHVEMDHSGGIPAIKKSCPNAKIYTSGAAGVKGLKAHYGEGSYEPVQSGGSISIGKRSLTFVATPMLHWPDNMVTYCPEEKILFSNDAFGQHLAGMERFDDEMDIFEVLKAAKGYYGNILMCYESQAAKALEVVRRLAADIIAPSHGVIWRSCRKEILDAYETWSRNQPEKRAMVVYDSMWHSTEQLAVTITESFLENDIPVKLYDLKTSHYSAILPELLTSRYLAVGSPTLNGQMLPSVAGFLSYLKGLTPGNRKTFAFGSYGWGGQSIGQIEAALRACSFDLCMEGFKTAYIPSKEAKQELREKIRDMLCREETA